MGKLYEPVEGVVGWLDDDGRGVLERADKKPLVMENVIPGERVRAITRHRSRGVIESELETVLEPSPARVTPVCPYAGVCGGCRWQHIDGGAQVNLKTEAINRTLQNAELDLIVSETAPCPEPFYYRNRMDYVFGKDGDLGLKLPGRWWETLDLETCFLLSKETPDILGRVRAWARESGLPFWNAKTHEGFFRYLVIREGKNTGERLIMLITSDTHALSETQQKAFVSLLDDVATSILWRVNPHVTDLSIPERMTALKGDPFLHERVNRVTYRIQPSSFFQTNTTMAAVLQDTVLAACADVKGKTALDLYCGSGFFSLGLAKSGARVIGIEIDERAVEAAKQNAELNHLNGLEFFSSKAETFDWGRYRPDVVILDPPRAGLHPSVIETLLAVQPPRLIYVSCKYQQFVKELPAFLKHYSVRSMKALDLFPQTAHVELVTVLDRQ